MVGPAVVAREQADEWVEDDKTGVYSTHGLQEKGKILRDGKGAQASWMRLSLRFRNFGEDLNAG